MLAQLTISNFAIVRELEIDFQNGMTVITGETGAGKSIAIDALGLCTGGRADADMVRAGATRADLCARFTLKDTPAALRWLEENQLEQGRECCYVALSAATDVHVASLTALPYRCHSCASWASCLFKSTVSMRISS